MVMREEAAAAKMSRMMSKASVDLALPELIACAAPILSVTHSSRVGVRGSGSVTELGVAADEVASAREWVASASAQVSSASAPCATLAMLGDSFDIAEGSRWTWSPANSATKEELGV